MVQRKDASNQHSHGNIPHSDTDTETVLVGGGHTKGKHTHTHTHADGTSTIKDTETHTQAASGAGTSPVKNTDVRATLETQNQTPTPDYILKTAPYVDTFNWLMVFPMYALAPSLFLLQIYFDSWLSWWQIACLPFWGYARNIVCFGLMHRFFSHRAWQCNRFTTFILGCMATLIGNRGPLWWSSKHMRHHKYCENEGEYPHNDPHSHFRYGWWYGYIGWTMSYVEKSVDWDFVNPEFKTWEMALVEALTWICPIMETLFFLYLHPHFALFHVYSSTIWIFITLCINSLTHYDGTPEPAPVNGRYKCKATNKPPLIMRYTLDLMGEMSHADHHRYPRKALRPSYLGIDVMYWVFIRPLESMGVFWDVKIGGGMKAAELSQ